MLGRFRHAPVFHDGDKHIQLPQLDPMTNLGCIEHAILSEME